MYASQGPTFQMQPERRTDILKLNSENVPDTSCYLKLL